MTEQQVAAPHSPYKGLAPFEDSSVDAMFFFGREREREIVMANLLAYRLTVLYGESGVGKSSLLQAGVAYTLRRQGEPVVVFRTWSGDPVSSMIATVRETLAASFPAAFAEEGAGGLAASLEAWTRGLDRDLYLILDQLDEYFLYHAGEERFARELAEAVTRPRLRVNVILSLRDDMLSRLDRFKALIPNLLSNYLRLDHLDRRAARDAIVRPLDQYNALVAEDKLVTAEPELVDAILDQTMAGRVGAGEALEGDRVEAPYLQLVMQRLWEEERSADSRTLRLETLERLGGAEEIVRAHLGEALASLSPADRDLAARLFNHLVTPSGTKIAHGIADLAQYASVSRQDVAPVLAALVDERIVRPVTAPGQPDGSRYEIFHDVLAEPVVAWRAKHEAERELKRAHQQVRRRNRRLLALTIASLVAVAAMVLVTIFALAQRREAQRQRTEAQAQERKARSGALTSRGALLLGTDPLLSLDDAVRAARLEPNSEVEDVLRKGILASPRAVLRVGAAVNDVDLSQSGLGIAGGDNPSALAFRWRGQPGEVVKRLPHGSPVKVALLNREGTLAVTAGGNRAIVWDLHSGSHRVLPQPSPVTDAALTHDADRLVTGGAGGDVLVWDTRSGKRLVDVAAGSPVRSVEVNRDGDRLLVVLGNGAVRLFDAHNGDVVNTFSAARVYKPQTQLFEPVTVGATNAAAFSPGGQLVVTGGNHKVFVWDLGRAVLHKIFDSSGHIVDVEFSPRGCCFVTANADGTATVWNAGAGRVAVLAGHTTLVRHASFSPDGTLVVTASTDGSARVWKAKSGRTLLVLAGHGTPVNDAVFSPNGTIVATAGADGTVRLWNGRPAPPLLPAGKERGSITAIAVASNGNQFVAGTSSGHASTWQVTPRRRLATVPTRGAILAATFAPEPLVLAGGSGRATIWNVRTQRRVRSVGARRATVGALTSDANIVATARGHRVTLWRAGERPIESFSADSSVTGLALSRDGRRLAVAGINGGVGIWNVLTGRRLSTCQAGRKELTSVSFDSTGTSVVASSSDHAAHICAIAPGRPQTPLLWHQGRVSAAAFSWDGRWVATAGPITAGVGAPDSPQAPLFLLPGHKKHTLLTAVAWSPHGYRIVTGDSSGDIRTYDCRLCGGASQLLRMAEERLSEISNR